jgi:hypothetical protein
LGWARKQRLHWRASRPWRGKDASNAAKALAMRERALLFAVIPISAIPVFT